jgi:hypothetical protein
MALLVGWLFLLMTFHQGITQQHHSPDQIKESYLRQRILWAGDDER